MSIFRPRNRWCGLKRSLKAFWWITSLITSDQPLILLTLRTKLFKNFWLLLLSRWFHAARNLKTISKETRSWHSKSTSKFAELFTQLFDLCLNTLWSMLTTLFSSKKIMNSFSEAQFDILKTFLARRSIWWTDASKFLNRNRRKILTRTSGKTLTN